MKKSVVYILLTAGIAWIAGLAAYSLMQGSAFQEYMRWAQENIVIFVITLIVIKSISVVFPPLPSVVMTLSAIPIVGWFNAYLIDYVGSILGSSVSYFIAYKYGVSVLSKILDKNTVESLNQVKIKKGREIEGVIVLRVLTGATLVEAVNYGAGLLKVPYNKFLIGFLISHPLFGIPTFYLVKNIIQNVNLPVTVLLATAGIASIYLLRNRYFEHEQI